MRLSPSLSRRSAEQGFVLVLVLFILLALFALSLIHI